MDIKKWLSRAYKIEQQITSKREQIEKWNSLAQKVTSNPQAVPVQGGYNESRLEKACCEIADIETEITKQLADLISAQKEISETISRVPFTTSRILLEQRYIICKGWEDIAEFMNYSAVYVKRDLHRQALLDIAPFIKDPTKYH